MNYKFERKSGLSEIKSIYWIYIFVLYILTANMAIYLLVICVCGTRAFLVSVVSIYNL